MEKERAREVAEGEKKDSDDTASTGSATDSATDSPVTARHLGPTRPLLVLLNSARSTRSEDIQNITNRVLDREKEEEKEAFDHAGEYKDSHYKRKGILYILNIPLLYFFNSKIISKYYCPLKD
jgi:hypothetical protein